MSDQSQGPGWWVASDGKWYPPEAHPDYRPPASAPAPPSAAGPPSQQQASQTPVAPPSRAEAKANAKAEAARAKAMRPWFRKKRFIIPIVVLVLGGIAAAASGGDDDDGEDDVATEGSGGDTDQTRPGASASSDDDELDDVTITKCEINIIGTVDVGLQVLNNSSKTSNYVVTVAVSDSTGARVGDGFASTNNLQPDQTANIDGFADVSDAAVEPITCEVAEVERYAS